MTNDPAGNGAPTSTDGASPDPAAPRRPSTGRRLFNGAVEIVIIFVGALIISAALRAWVGQMFIIPSGSMENTLKINDRVAVSKLTHFKRGDIVVFKDPGNWLDMPPQDRTGYKKVLEDIGLLPSTASNHLIKRVIGMPGDDVKCCDVQGRITVNGVPLNETSYLYSANGVQVKPAAVPFEVVVPAGRIFVMGDHRDASGDSRCHLADISNDGQPQGADAFVPISDVVGPAVAIVAPLDRIRLLTVPSTFKNIPNPSGSPPQEATIIPKGVGCS
ncbi:MAG TPA: signal peptidase I [Propionibacteriaceae bacterium]|nr:signal peptidase I [Propionibacteriaceae bacterium]